MPTFEHRAGRAALLGLLALLLAGCGPGRSLGASSDLYAAPGRLVKLDDGRSLNLRCRGRGSPTVLMESGWGANSRAWEKVQPTVAKTTRVCAYDRAGYGFSDPGPLPRDGAAVVRDLDAVLEKAGERGPYIFVGHSAGALYGRIFAAGRPRDIAGLILLDPTIERRAPQPAGDGLDGIRRRLTRCLAVAEISPQPPVNDPAWAGCVSSRADDQARAAAMRPEVWRNQLSELDAIFGRTTDQVMRIGGALRSVPTYVITASETADSGPMIGGHASLVELRHQMIAGAARDSSQRTVISSHLVMVDRPDVVLDAIGEMVRAVRAERLPPPLPPSETTRAPPRDPLASPFEPAGSQAPFPENPFSKQ